MVMHGWINIDKPSGVSSFFVVKKVRFLLKSRKVGHSGTLDPMASGILPIAIGEATKTINYVMDGDKEYLFTVCFGKGTDTDDGTGKIIATTDYLPSKILLNSLLRNFIGVIKQIPPVYSAIHIDGRRAYDLARNDISVSMPERTVKVNELEIISVDNPEKVSAATFRMVCGKGTYVRSVARDLAKAAGSMGYVSMLRRTRVKNFSTVNAFSLDKFEELVHTGPESEFLMPVDIVLDDILALSVTEDQASFIRHGRSVFLNADNISFDLVRAIDPENRVVAIGQIHENYFKPARVFNY